MHPRTEELALHLAVTREELRATVHATPAEHLERSQHIDGWTIVEILDHLAKIERMVAGVVAREVGSARANGLRVESSSDPQLESFGGYRVRRRSVKVASPTFGIPARGIGVAAAWAALAESRGALLAVLRSTDGLALGDVSAPHQFLGTLNMYQWIAFVGFHEQRHADQITETASALA